MKTRLLFVGATGRIRAPIAAALAAALAGENAVIQFTAISPGIIDPLARRVMAERGIEPPVTDPGRDGSAICKFDHIFPLCDTARDSLSAGSIASTANGVVFSGNGAPRDNPEMIDWSCPEVPHASYHGDDEASPLSQLRSFRDDMERKLRDWLDERELLSRENAPVQNVWRELARYEHPLFDWEAVSVAENVEVRIRFKPPASLRDSYSFQLRPRELENRQFPWLFQKQLYDCLHDYVVELFSRNPQQDES